jgi:hypothetical protein
MPTKMKGPFVNLNGASRESLIQQAFDVSAAAETLIQKLGLAAPHGRDYQTVGSDKYWHDKNVWQTYLEHVRDMYEEYRGIGERLYLEGEERKRGGKS